MLLKKIMVVGILIVVLLLMPVSPIQAMPALPHDIKQQLYDLGVIDSTKAPDKLSELNMLWAFGLANKNEILENGPMMDPKYGGADNFASIGGWTLAKGSAMDHYSHHEMLKLTPEQQKKVKRTSKNIYRPCCNNPAYFPDCNHGMAMLGALEIMASQGASEREMYRIAEDLNKQWFPPKPTSGCTV